MPAASDLSPQASEVIRSFSPGQFGWGLAVQNSQPCRSHLPAFSASLKTSSARAWTRARRTSRSDSSIVTGPLRCRRCRRVRGGNDEPLDLAVRKTMALHRGDRGLRDASLNKVREIGLGIDLPAENAPSATLAVDHLDEQPPLSYYAASWPQRTKNMLGILSTPRGAAAARSLGMPCSPVGSAVKTCSAFANNEAPRGSAHLTSLQSVISMKSVGSHL
jgi:hypothetical protein